MVSHDNRQLEIPADDVDSAGEAEAASSAIPVVDVTSTLCGGAASSRTLRRRENQNSPDLQDTQTRANATVNNKCSWLETSGLEPKVRE